MEICPASGDGWTCDRPVDVGRSMCQAHAWQQRVNGQVTQIRTAYKKTACYAAGDGWSCDRPATSKGLCEKHRRQQRRGVQFSQERIRPTRGTCTASGDGWVCDQPHRSHGLCSRHYNQQRIGNPLTPHTAKRTQKTAGPKKRAAPKKPPTPAVAQPSEPWIPGTLDHRTRPPQSASMDGLVEVAAGEPASRAAIDPGRQ